MIRSFVFACVLTKVSFGGALHVVDSTGAGDFLDLQSAIDAAAEGDSILVNASGPVGEGVVQGKSLSILGFPQASIVAGLTVRALTPEQTVVVRGLRIDARNSFLGDQDRREALVVDQCAGAVRVELCEVFGEQGVSAQTISPSEDQFAWPAVAITSSADVGLFHCAVEGGDGAIVFDDFTDWFTSPGAPGVDTALSNVAIHHSVVRGGEGGANEDGDNPDGADGGPGLRVDGGDVRLSDVEVRGGKGGDGTDDLLSGTASNGGDGGPGLLLLQGVVRARASSFHGGGAGLTFAPGQPGVPGADVEKPGGTLLRSTGEARSLESDGWISVSSGVQPTVRVEALPGELALLRISLGADRTVVRHDDVLFHGPVQQVLTLGVVPSTGSITAPLPLPGLGSREALPLHLQAALVGPSGTRFSGASCPVVVE